MSFHIMEPLHLNIFSVHIHSMWETICDAKVVFWLKSKFCPNCPVWPQTGISDQFTPPLPPPKMKNFPLEINNVYSGLPPQTEKLLIWDHQSLLVFTPQLKKLRLEMTKVYCSLPHQTEQPGDCMWRLICKPPEYHLFSSVEYNVWYVKI